MRGIPLYLMTLFAWPVSSVVADQFTISEIADGVFMHAGVHAGFNDPQHDDIANIGFIIGEKCVAVIDTGGSVQIGQKLLEAIHQKTNNPICYVINTHVHFDHVLGNLPFVQEHPEFWGHQELKSGIENNRDFFLENFHDELGKNPDQNSIIGPDKTVTDRQLLDLGNREIVLTAWPAAHTHSDLTVLDKKTGVIWTGDLVFRERIPVIDGSLKGWLDVMEKLKQIDVTKIIPGHGPVAENWQEAMSAQENYLKLLLSDTREAIANGMFMEEAIDTIGTDQKDKWLLFDQNHRSNVSKAFTELEWE